ncbi:hypothetical protein MTR_8g078420 [Medicago truncatula]|uniref:Uncharacterized protein n=1 Tax=Medicago truncatula TaxID=3880 RepID=G7LFL0_MEDTR|nr:hypothetical protein MTR_8g078420 [Medicago truncatula]
MDLPKFDLVCIHRSSNCVPYLLDLAHARESNNLVAPKYGKGTSHLPITQEEVTNHVSYSFNPQLKQNGHANCEVIFTMILSLRQ